MDYEQSIAWIRRRAETQRSIARHDLRVRSDAVCKANGLPTRQQRAFADTQQAFRDLGAAAKTAADLMHNLAVKMDRGRTIRFVEPV